MELWESPPFEPTVRGEWLYARGVADDKGQLYLLLRAAADLAAEGGLPVNVRVVCDGEEETGGHSIVDYLAVTRGADACVIFDGNMPARGRSGLLRRGPAASSTSTSVCARASGTSTRASTAGRR